MQDFQLGSIFNFRAFYMKDCAVTRVFTLFLWFVGILLPSVEASQNFDELDAIVYSGLETFKTPGIAIGVVVDGGIVFAKGYGLRNVDQNYPVTTNTLFGLGSGTKPFTSFLLGQLISEGKIRWDDPVQKYLPEFSFLNSRKFRPITIRDLLSHSSGLPRHDLLWYNAPLKRQQLLEKLSLLELNCAPGSKFQYNNMAFTIAAMVFEHVEMQSWEDGLKARILSPLNMLETNSTVKEMESSKDFSLPYISSPNGITSIPARSYLTAPSSSINASISDMCKWLQLLLRQGTFSEKELIDKAVFREMISSQQIPGYNNSISCFQFEGIGLGWMIGNYKGERVIYHGGHIEGFVSLTAILPSRNIALAILCNTNSAGFHLITTLTHSILHHLLGLEQLDWIEQEKCEYEAKMKTLPNLEKTEKTASYFRSFVGIYENPAYGRLELRETDGYPLLSFHDLELGLVYHGNNQFIVTSLVPALPHFSWPGEISLNCGSQRPALFIQFESEAPPIVFSFSSP